MKKSKRFLALAGVIILVALYAATLVFALIDNPWAYDLFRLSIGATIILPVLLYAIILIARVLGNKDNEKEDLPL